MEDRLYRSHTDRVIAGVAGGLADRLDLDPSLVRVLWVILIPFTGGMALLAYIVLAIVVPEEPYPGAGRAPWTQAGAGGPATGWGEGWSGWAATAPPPMPPAPGTPGGPGGEPTAQAPDAAAASGPSDGGPTGAGTSPEAAGAPGASTGFAAGGGPAATPPPSEWQAGWGWDHRAQRRADRAAWRAQRAAWRAERHDGNGAIIAGLVLIVLGALFLANQLIPDLDWSLTWPVAIIALGVVLLVGSLRRAP